MSFFAASFLGASIAIGIPILIALWNRRRHRQEKFGGYFLLQKIIETTKKRLRLVEILKLLNRIALILLVIGFFAEPLKERIRESDASDGFAILLDVSRVMQAGDLITQQKKKLREWLDRIPSQSQGSVLFVSNRCEPMKLSENRLTGRASEWLDALDESELPYNNSEMNGDGLAQCLNRVGGLFEGKEILKVFISPLPASLSEESLKSVHLNVETLVPPKLTEPTALSIQQDLQDDRLRLFFTPPESREAFLISNNRVEPLGHVTDSLDLVSSEKAWLWLRGSESEDSWGDENLVSLQQRISKQIYVWAQKETPGFVSLVAALRNHPDLKVVRELGGEASGEPLIVYGNFNFQTETMGRTWFFLDPEGQSSFRARDKKQWTSSFSSPDLLKAFQMQTQDGTILIKKYLLLDLDRFETIESFQDGAPSLLKDRLSRATHWISPFDLEDLSTDLALEPTFIPYLYRRIDRWLGAQESNAAATDYRVVWSMPGKVKPTAGILKRRDWPGVYVSGDRAEIVEPRPCPTQFLKWAVVNTSARPTEVEHISMRPLLLKLLLLSIFLELFLCLSVIPFKKFGLGLFLLALFAPANLHAADLKRGITLGVWPGMDSDRKKSLEQFEKDIERLSNLDFESPSEINFNQIWNKAMIVVSSNNRFGPFSQEQREKIRDYCERGGLLIFDDPLATSDTGFYRSVKEELALLFPGRGLKAVPKDDVVFRSFYLLDEVSGRKLANPNLEGISLDKRWVVLFSSNDLLGSQLRLSSGDYALSVQPYGITQRILARRLLLNLLMYGVTLDYKDDAIHLPHILKRRVR